MDPRTKDILQAQWPEIKGQVKQQWASLPTMTFSNCMAQPRELAGVLQQRYGYGKAQAKIEINQWVKCEQRTSRRPKNSGNNHVSKSTS